MKYKAIIFDLDGTAVVNAGNTPTLATCKTVRACRDKIILCAATGRSWPEAKNVIKSLGIHKPCILSGGTIIVDPLRESILWQETIPAETMQSVLDITNLFPYKIIYSQGLKSSSVINISSIEKAESVNIFYILDVPVNHKHLEQLIYKLESIESITVAKAASWNIDNGLDLHITSKTATKEHAVVELCNILSIDRTRVAGVGDGHNDVHLFNAVGYKIAMGNAVQELKEASDEVILSVDEDGLAKFIQEAAAQ